MRFTIWIVQPLMEPMARAYVEAASGIYSSLSSLGHEVAFDPGRGTYIQNPLPFTDGKFGRLIIFGANRLPAVPLPEDAIIFNAEQVQVDGDWGAAWKSSHYIDLLRRHTVWDYSESNAEKLRELGVQNIKLCRVGYYPELSNIPSVTEDVDVLFCGNSNDRRVRVIQEIARNKINIRCLVGVFGEERDRWIARAKVLLNVHFYPRPVFEIFRVSHLLANKKCVVSENGGVDPELETLASKCTAYVPYEKLAETCISLVRNEALRKEIADRGFLEFSKISQVAEVERALNETKS